jgi:hypothetical protein
VADAQQNSDQNFATKQHWVVGVLAIILSCLDLVDIIWFLVTENFVPEPNY